MHPAPVFVRLVVLFWHCVVLLLTRIGSVRLVQGRATFLTAVYMGAFGAAHPLAKKLGAWPAVYTVTAVTALSSIVIGRKRQK